MAPKKLWRPVKEWVPRDWATMKEAWLRVYGSLSEDMALTRLDVKADLLAGRLVGAARVFAPDGIERGIIFEREFWEPVEIPMAWSVTGWEEHCREGEKWCFFVRRRELDRRYPASDAVPREQQTDDLLLHRKTGPKAKWRLPAAAEMHRIRKEEQRTPTAVELCEFCHRDKTVKYYPDESEMGKLMRFLLAE